MKKILTLFFLALQFSCNATIWTGTNSTPQQGDAGTPSIPDPRTAPSDTPTPAEDIRTHEEYAVFDAILEKLYGTGELRCIVLKDNTTARHLVDTDEKNLEYVRTNLPEIPQGVWEDFLKRNQTPIALQPAFHSAVPVALISEEEINEIFFIQEGDGWERFYNLYPGAQGIMDISQPGFNPGLDQALVYAGDQSNYLAGLGFLYYLEKDGGSWTVRNSVMVWIS